MEQRLYAIGAVVGLIASLFLAPSYEPGTFLDRAFIACVMFATTLCIGGYFMPYLRDRDDRR